MESGGAEAVSGGAEAVCRANWGKVITFCSSVEVITGEKPFLVLVPLLERATYAPKFDTMCVPKDAIAENYPEKAKESIKAYEQLCGLALLFNANKDLPGKGEFKKMPIYGRGANSELQDKLCRMDMLQPPDLPQYLGYLR